MPEIDALKTEIVKDQRVDITTITQTFITTERFDTSSEPIELPSKKVTDIIHDENDNEPISENVFIETTQDFTEQIPSKSEPITQLDTVSEPIEIDETEVTDDSSKEPKDKFNCENELDQTYADVVGHPDETLQESKVDNENVSKYEPKSDDTTVTEISKTDEEKLLIAPITEIQKITRKKRFDTSSEPIELPSKEVTDIIHDENDNEPISENVLIETTQDSTEQIPSESEPITQLDTVSEPIEISSNEMPETDALKTEIVKDQQRFDTSSEPIELPSKEVTDIIHDENDNEPISENVFIETTQDSTEQIPSEFEPITQLDTVESTSAPESKSQKDDTSTITQTFITTEITKVIEESLPQEIHTSNNEPIREYIISETSQVIEEDSVKSEPITQLDTVSEPIEIHLMKCLKTDALKTEIVKDQRKETKTPQTTEQQASDNLLSVFHRVSVEKNELDQTYADVVGHSDEKSASEKLSISQLVLKTADDVINEANLSSVLPVDNKEVKGLDTNVILQEIFISIKNEITEDLGPVDEKPSEGIVEIFKSHIDEITKDVLVSDSTSVNFVEAQTDTKESKISNPSQTSPTTSTFVVVDDQNEADHFSPENEANLISLEEEGQKLLDLILSASTDLEQMPRKNLDQMLETLTALSKKLDTYSTDMNDLITKSELISNDDLKNNLMSLKGKLDSLILRTNHQILVTNEAKALHARQNMDVEKYRTILINIEEWLQTIITKLNNFDGQVKNKEDAENKIKELQTLIDQLEEKKKVVNDIGAECQSTQEPDSDLQKMIEQLMIGLNTNIEIIRENQDIFKYFIDHADEPDTIEPEIIRQQEIEAREISESKPAQETQSTQTTPATSSTDNFMIIQSIGAEGETIQIYNMPSVSEEGTEDDKNITVEAKYVRGHVGDAKRASELVLKNIPKHFETTVVEPDETTTEIIVDPEGNKKIIVKKLTKTTHQVINQEIIDDEPQWSIKGSHDIILKPDEKTTLEQYPDITQSSLTAVIEHVSHRIIKKTRRIIKKVTIIDGQEHITEEVVEEPDEVEETEEHRELSQPTEISQGVIIEEPVEKISEKVQELKEEIETIEPIKEEIVEKIVIEEIIEEKKIDEPKIEEEKTSPVTEEIQQKSEVIEEILKSSEDAPIVVETSSKESSGEQVFEIVTDAQVDLKASKVDKDTPIEDIETIWPYSTPHISSQTIFSSESPDTVVKDSDTSNIWPHNVTIGSDIKFNEYSFERTIEQPINDKIDTIEAGRDVIQQEEIPIKETVISQEGLPTEKVQKPSEGSLTITKKTIVETIEKFIEQETKDILPPEEKKSDQIISEEPIKSDEFSKDEIPITFVTDEVIQPIENIVIKTESEEPKIKDHIKSEEIIKEEKPIEAIITNTKEIMIEKTIETREKEPEKSTEIKDIQKSMEKLLKLDEKPIEKLTKSDEIPDESLEKLTKSDEIIVKPVEEPKKPEEKPAEDEPKSDKYKPIETSVEETVQNKIEDLPQEIVTDIALQPEKSQKIEEKPEETLPNDEEKPIDDMLVVEEPSQATITITKETVILTQDKEPLSDVQETIHPPEIVTIKDDEPKQETSPPPPQIATITIIKTMTFLEQEKQNANELIPESIETRMLVRTPEPNEIEQDISQIEELTEPQRPELQEISQTVITKIEQPIITTETSQQELVQIVTTQRDQPEKPEFIISEDTDLPSYHVVLKVDPSEVTKINVNLSEEMSKSETPSVEEAKSPEKSPEVSLQPEISEVPVVPDKSEVFSEEIKVRSTEYEGDAYDEDNDGSQKKKKKKDKKKKQKIKPEEVPSIDAPKSTESSHRTNVDSSILSSDNDDTVIPQEEHLPEGREEIMSPDESYSTISDFDNVPTVKVLEENVIKSPDESLTIQSDIGFVIPSGVIEFVTVGDTEQQTEPIDDSEQKPTPSAPVLPSETKEIQVLYETNEFGTQMSPSFEQANVKFELPQKDITDGSMQTIITQFIESECQTMDYQPDEKPEKELQEQEIQTEDQIKSDEIIPKQETSAQTVVVETVESVVQTQDEIDDGKEISQQIVSEIIQKATEEKEPIKVVEEIKPQVVTTDAETQTKKSKKDKKKKQSSTTELEIETNIQGPSDKQQEKSVISMSIAPEVSVEKIDVHVNVARPSDPGSDVLRRLNNIIDIETNEPPKETFVLSQNLNNVINKIEDDNYQVPWNELNDMIDTNMENRRVNNSNDIELNYIVEEPTDSDINESLQKIEQYIELLPEVIKSNDDKTTQKSIIVITKIIITCLEQIEYKIQYMKQKKEKTPKESEELARLQKLIESLNEKVSAIPSHNVRENVYKCVHTLKEHADLDTQIQKNVADDINSYYFEIDGLNDSVRHLQQETHELEELQRKLAQQQLPNDETLRQWEKLEHEIQSIKLKALKLLKSDNLNEENANQVKICYNKTKDIEHTVKIEKRKLILLINLIEEYVQTLNEFSQITLIADSLVDKTIMTNSLDNLQNEIQRHRKFFVNLNHCCNILESLEKNLDPETRKKHEKLHNKLYEKATNILEKARERSQKLSLAASRWTVLEQRMKNEEQWLQVANQRVPDLSAVTSADYEQYITLYQSINTDLTIHQAKMLQNYETAIKLQDLICAPNLETKCNDTLTKLVKIKEDVNAYLAQLKHFKQEWNDYNSNADKLEHWMNHVEDELDRIHIPDDFLAYPVENMRNFWEIKAQYEVNNQIHKNACGSFDRALKVISLADDKLQLQFYTQLENRWGNVSSRIEGIKSQIIGNISSAVPSYNDKLLYLERELDELLFIINNTKGIIRNPEELHLYTERLIVLKSRIIAVENELVTIGFISTADTEKVGELCEKSHKIFLYVSEEMELADLCKERLNTLKQEIELIRGDQVEYRKDLIECESAAKLESTVVEKALDRCKTIRDSLVTHWKDIMRVRHLLHTLPTGLRMSVSPVDVEKDISQLEDDYVEIEKHLCEVENLLKNRFALWKRFEKQLEAINQSIQETDFMVELLTVHGNIDYDRLLKATERLEGLYDELEMRDDAIKDLKIYAQPIIEFCEEHVAQDIENTMQKASSKWNETNDNLQKICDKYKGAVNLWRKYCEESEAIRNVIDEQLCNIDDLMQNKSVEEIEVLEAIFSTQQDKLGELQKLAAQISEYIGTDTSIQIDSDIIDLQNQLSEIADTIEACKNISSNSNKLQASRKVLLAKSNKLIDNVTEDLKQQSTPSNDENQLGLLRSHLLNIAVIENDLQNQKAIVNMNDNESENFIVKTLDSLQKLFKQTITEYNKLSSQLVHNADNSIIIKIWSDYLAHVDSFLQSPIASDYNVLKEQLHLCKIHQNLIANQRNALMHKISGDNRMVMVNEFDEFKKRHVKIFNILYERQREIESRIDAWEKYRKRQSNVLEFIDSIEREKSILNLHQIFIKDIPKTKVQVEGILNKVSEAENCVTAIKDNQAALLNFLDDITLSTLRLEFASTNQRLANIRASLETWLDYLLRISELNNTYDAHVKNIQDSYQWHLNFLSNTKHDMSVNFEKCKQNLDLLKEKQKMLHTIQPELENLSAIKGEMKDYISSYDVKMIRQTIWVLWQQYTDLNHEYSVLLNQIEERICLQTEFVIRYDNLLFWLNETEGRLMEASAQRFYSGRPQDDGSSLSKYYATNILEEFTLKEYDRKWVQSVGNDLILFYKTEQHYDSPEKIDIECKLSNLNTKWNNVKSMYNNRSSKVNEIKMTYYNLEARIAEIRAWLFETEKELLKPFVFESATKEAYEKQLIEYEKIQRSVEKNSANVAEILNLSEMLLSELISFDIEISLKNLESAINNIDNRWKKLCDSLVNRKKNLISLWNNIHEMTTVTNNNKSFIIHCDELCTELEEKLNVLLSKEKAIGNIKVLDENYEELIQKSPEIHTLERLYNTILTANIDLTNSRNITSETKKILVIWKTLPSRMTSLKSLLESFIAQYQKYEIMHENIILKLTQIDLDITNLKHLNNYPDNEQQKRFSELKSNFEECEKLIQSAEAEKRQLMENANENERMKLKQMSDEYNKLLNDIKLNIDEMNEQYSQANEGVKEIEVAVQVNTLEAQQSVSPKDAYQYEIQTAIKEFRTSIVKLQEQLESVDVNNSSGIIPKATSQKIGKSIAACESSLELIKYLNSLLINDYGCDDKESYTKEIETLYDQFRIQMQIWNDKKEHKKQQFGEHSLESDWRSCPFCSQRNWQQIDNDLWRLEQWLHVAENERRNQQTPPSNIEELEDTIQDHREFLLNLDSHKSIISSLNIVGEHLALHTNDTAKAQQLRKRLADNNHRWEQICQHATTWQSKLQDALIGNREFHKIINEFYAWLEDTERKVKHFEPVDLSSDKSVMESKFMRFKELKSEIERCEPRVISLQENSSQLLKSSGEDRIAKDTFTKLTDLSVKLQSLRRLTALYVIKLGHVLGYDEAYINAPLTSSQFDEIGSTSSSVRTLAQSENYVTEEEDINITVLTRSYRFLGRVIRASLPIQCMMLVLLGACVLIPIPNSEEGGYSCLLTNTFGRMEPMLRYRNGNPPI
ncbi:hypothetical protein PVAND_006514 [Polypedilum vanderplanki]|uniref:KASH domain-containing protein n=1 Tax=Polypedilum vanderplanki TaxID=319348 RepID=A0A9J6C3E7_POLVA|nr:hypothetical protein PVAND_006514 [Polypedilum vanderplanki]